MDAERWLRLSPLLDALLELPEDMRSEHLAALRREDGALADELEKLLAMELFASRKENSLNPPLSNFCVNDVPAIQVSFHS